MVKKNKIKRIEHSLSQELIDRVLSNSALAAMREHKNGLPAAMVFCGAVGLPLPEWAIASLAVRQIATDISAQRARQRKNHSLMVMFIKDLLRYRMVRAFDGEHSDKGNDKMERAFEEMEGLWFAPKDSSGLRKSFYKFQRMFGKRHISLYVAARVVAAWMKH